MNIVKYIFWLVAFLMGVIAAYVVPEETMSIGAKFIFVGAWGAVLGFVFYTVCSRQIEAIEIELFGCPLREDAETLATPLDWPPHRLLPWFLL